MHVAKMYITICISICVSNISHASHLWIIPYDGNTIKSAPLGQRVFYYAAQYFPRVIDTKKIDSVDSKTPKAFMKSVSSLVRIHASIRFGAMLWGTCLIENIAEKAQIPILSQCCRAIQQTSFVWNLVSPWIEYYCNLHACKQISEHNMGVHVQAELLKSTWQQKSWREKPPAEVQKTSLEQMSLQLEFARPWGLRFRATSSATLKQYSEQLASNILSVFCTTT